MNMRNDVWIKRSSQDPQSCFRLFCFPYAGGGASFFRTWRERLGPDIEVCAIQLPGREDRLAETHFVRLSTLIYELAEVLYPYLDFPFAFFGHSLGSLISFELTRWLRRHKAPCPMQLFVYDHEAPLDCPITAFGGLEDEEVNRDELAAWHDQTRSRFHMQMFPGDHFFLNGKERNGLLEIISKDIRKITGKTK